MRNLPIVGKIISNTMALSKVVYLALLVPSCSINELINILTLYSLKLKTLLQDYKHGGLK